MKRVLLSVLVMAFAFNANAQTDYIKPKGLGIHFVLNDYKTASYIRTYGLGSAINDKKISKLSDMYPGMAVSYIAGLGSHLDGEATLSGSFVNYATPSMVKDGSNNLLLEGTAMMHLKLLTDKYCINPYLAAGVGVSKYKGYWAAFAPLGVGVQFKIVDDVFMMVNSQYRVPVTGFSDYHFYHSLGVVKTFPKEVAPEVALPVVPVVADRDGDGINDNDDKCPDVAGLATLQGCPDRDADGIADGDDKCPDVAGVARYQGCPIPDTDGDGINDEEDKCPTVKGVARYQGCPIPDTDGDGVNDEEDKCKDRPGPASNYGCPEIKKEVIEKINYAAKNVYFATASYKLLPKSFKPLNDVVAIMKADETLKLAIDGHTDSQGSDEYNQTLSENRAKSVKDYLVSKGIDESRLISAGYGETKPVADNATAAGRAKNRRTEITVTNY